MNRVHRIAGTVMNVNAFVIEGDNAAVLVDGMLTVSDAADVRKRIDEIGKPLVGAIVTHAHPDHYAGLSEILRGKDLPILATPAVRTIIERDDATKNSIVGPMMGKEWPSARIFPNTDAQGSIELAGITLHVEDVGPAESPADSLWRFQDDFFVGDLVYAGMHAYLADGFAQEWLALLVRLEREIPSGARLYVGHGAPGGRELFATQRRYITAFRDAVARHRDKPPAERRAAVVTDMKRLLPTDDLAFLMELSVDPFAQSQNI